MEDDHVDRPGVEAQQCVQLTGTNSSLGLIALICQCASAANDATNERPVLRMANSEWRMANGIERNSLLPSPFAIRHSPFALCFNSVLRRPGGSQRGDQTRSHPELGRQTPQRQWYFVSRHGRVGRRQACKGRKLPRNTNEIGKRGSRQ